MSQTILELTQNILSAMSSDSVSSISDTEESLAVARILEATYNHITSTCKLPEAMFLYQLVASGDDTKPTLMTLPSNARSMKWLKYDMQTEDDPISRFEHLQPLTVEEFFHRQHMLRTDNDNVSSLTITNDSGDVLIHYFETDHAPRCYTSFDDQTILFDAYDEEVDTTLQRSKTLAYGDLSPFFQLLDSFIPALDDQLFSLLYNEAKSLAFVELKQTQHPKAERWARDEKIVMQRDRDAVKGPFAFYNTLPNYGRK